MPSILQPTPRFQERRCSMSAMAAGPVFVDGRTGTPYVGFWQRALATVIDAFLLMLICVPLLLAVYGSEYYDRPPTSLFAGRADFFINLVLPAIIVITFWHTRGATPGKMAIGARIVDAETLERPALSQLVLRYVGYFPATLVLCIGILAVAFDRRKQGWHDKMGRTVVISTRR